MNLEEEGFLSPDIEEWIALNKQANAPWLKSVRALNRLAQRCLISLTVDGDDMQAIYVSLLFVRGVTNFQGALVLAERGLILGARILLRSCFEDVFYMGAVRSHKTYYEKLAHDDQVVRKRLARALLKIPDHLSGLTDTHIGSLNEFIAGLPESLPKSTLDVAQAARDAGLGAVYDTYYRGLSNDAAHPSVVALGRHVAEDEPTFLWGPEPDQMVDTLGVACTAVFYLLTGVRDHFGLAEQLSELEDRWAEFRALLRSSDPED